MENFKSIAIIPARGGSKRIPGKNIKDFLGKPIIAYSIEAAKKSNLFDQIIVSTDDQGIADISLKYGASIPFMRSTKNSDDFATTMDVLTEVLSEFKEKSDTKFEFVCCIYPTAPLINYKRIQEGFRLITDNEYYCVYPVCRFSYPIWRGLEITKEGKTAMIWPEYMRTRSQDLKKVYHDAGQWYWYRSNKLINSEFIKNIHTIILDDYEVQDIDNLMDWKLAEMKYKLINEEKNIH